jgi:hypothetical protein
MTWRTSVSSLIGLALVSMLSFDLVSAQDAAPNGTEVASGPAAGGPAGLPSGIIAVQQWLYNRPDQPFAFHDEVYQNPSVSGVLFRANWSSVEPRDGEFQWQIIDDMFSAAATNGKFVALSFVPGFATPAWALSGVQTATFDWQYGPRGEAGQTGTLPIPWDAAYLSRWYAFLQAVADRYGTNPQFRMISLAGPTSVSDETSLPNNPQDPGLPNHGSDINQWLSLGYTPAKYEEAWKSVLAHYAQIFPRQYFVLATARTLPIGDDGKRNASQETSTLQSVIADGLSYPDRFVLQDSGLTASRAELQAQNRTVLFDIVGSYSGKIVTGFQVGTSATLNPGPQGDASDPVNALSLSLTTGLAEHPDYLEVWEQDVTNPAMQDVLQMAQSQLPAGAPPSP